MATDITEVPSSNATVEFKGESLEVVAREASANTHSATRNVLGNYELLENILSFLNFEDLVRAQEVDTGFNYVTLRSKTWRKNLYWELEEQDFTKLLEVPIADHCTSFRRVPKSKYVPTEKPHPLLRTDFLGEWEPLFEYMPVRWVSKMSWDTLKRLLDNRGRLWEWMYATRPQAVSVHIWIDEFLMFKEEEACVWQDGATIENAEGVRLGDVVDGMCRLLESEERKTSHAGLSEECSGQKGKSRFVIGLNKPAEWR